MTHFDLSQLHVLDAIDHAVTVLDRDGVVQEWNPGAERLYGWTREQAVGRRVADLLNAESPRQNAAIKGAIDRGRAWVGDYEARRKDNSPVLVHSSV
jgi:PAS domain S-box-containing protein